MSKGVSEELRPILQMSKEESELPPGPSERGCIKEGCFRLCSVQANTGSVARDHLANERTFLSWFRTGMATIALGVAIAKFGKETNSEEAGLVFVVLGIVFLCFSTMRYYFLFFLLKRDLFAPNTCGIFFILVLCFISASLTVFLVIVGD